MTRQKPLVDGFIPRRTGSRLGEHHLGGRAVHESAAAPGAEKVTLASQGTLPQLPINSRRDLDESLKSIDLNEPDIKGKKGSRKDKKPKSKARRIIKWVIIALIVIGVAVGAWVVYRAMNAGTSIFKGSLLDIIQTEPLKQDANGRSNILILGTSDDDPGHQGATLTDSIMVLSVDQKNKNAYMISIPRDLEVEYGQGCLSGYSGKINVYFSCVGGGTDDIEATRSALMKESSFVGEMLGMDIQYGVNVNYTVLRELVGALGGITVTIESRDPRGQMDGNFDWKCGLGDPKVSRAERLRRCPPNGHFIDYPNGPVHLDAEHALYLAQARGDTAVSYGFEQSNFDREKNQQMIVKAIREKAMSAGVLGDFGKVSGILDSLGNNLRTTFNTKEVRTLVNLARDIKSEDVQSISLIDGDNPVMNGNAQPSAGRFQYRDIQALLRKKLSSDPVVREEAKVVVMNASGVAGVAQTEADKLEQQGFTISSVENAPAGTYGDVEVYQIGEGMSATKAKLESLYKIKVKTTTPPAVAEGVNFVIVVGKAPSTQ